MTEMSKLDAAMEKQDTAFQEMEQQFQSPWRYDGVSKETIMILETIKSVSKEIVEEMKRHDLRIEHAFSEYVAKQKKRRY